MDEFSKILTYLHETKILNDDNRSLVLKYKNIVPLAAGLKRLQRGEILNQDIFKSLISHLNPDEFSKIIRDLSQ